MKRVVLWRAFHPEVTHTAKGEELLANFVHKFVDVAVFGRLNTSLIYVEQLREQIGNEKYF